MRRLQPLLAAATSILLAGCPGIDISSDDGYFDVLAPVIEDGDDPLPAVRSSQFLDLRNDTLLLEGTVLCGRLDSDVFLPTDDETAWESCYDVELDGVTAEDMGGGNTCWTVEAGDVTWTFTPVTCALADLDDLPDDVLRLTGVPADEVSGAFLPFPEFGAWEHLVDQDGGSYPDSLVDPLPSPLTVAAGAVVRLEAGLTTEGSIRPVGWTQEHGRVRYEVVEGPDPKRLEVTGAEPEAGEANAWTFTVNLKEGTVLNAFLDIGGESFDLGEIRAVAKSEAAEISVDVAFDGDEPAGARAVVLDADGNRIFGMPMRWTTEPQQLSIELGTGAFDNVPHLMGGDYVRLDDKCRKPSAQGGDFETTVAVEAGGLTGEVDISWSAPENDDEDTGWTPPATCKPAGCGCDSAAGDRRGSVLALLLVIAAGRRRSGATARA